MSQEKTESTTGISTELIALGIEVAKEVAQAELPIFDKYLKGRLAYWENKGDTHWLKIILLKEEIGAVEDIIKAITPEAPTS